jgi:hypothetical protein
MRHAGDSFSRCENGCNGVVDGEVSDLNSEDLVARGHHPHGIVEEHVAAHQFVDQIFLDQNDG